MSLASNQREQLMKRLKQDLQLQASEYTFVDDSLSDGSPALQIKSGADVHFFAAIQRKSFNGFNVVAELSSSAAEGLPEHDLWLAADNTKVSISKAAKVSAIAKKIGTASLKICSVAGAVSASSCVDSAVTDELGNDARIGASGA